MSYKLRESFVKLNKSIHDAEEVDVNKDREKLEEVAEEICKYADEFRKVLKEHKGEFKKVTHCLHCKLKAVEYDEVFKNQVCSCAACGGKSKVRLYKNGQIKVEILD